MLEVLAVAVCLPFVLGLPFVALTYGFFWYETVNGAHRSKLTDLSGGHPVLWVLRGMLSGVVAVAIVIVSFPFGWVRLRKCAATRSGDLPPVLLVHGLYHNPGAWLLYQRWLRRGGYRCVETFSYSSWGCTFDDLTLNLSRAIEELRSEAGKPVVVIGHSLGGLLGRVCAQQPENRNRIAALVTLGSPHRGSKLAALAFGKLGRSLLFGGELIDRVERGSLPASLPRLAVVSPVDNMVLPNEALRVREEEWCYHETGPISHVSMLYHAPTAKRVIQFLDDVLSGTRDCCTRSGGR
ncbi:MAG: esterase/lipase family protein [Syntrophobacteraceae bacterium]